MRATANTILSTVVPEVKLDHKGETISFSISVFQRANFQGQYDVFGYINNFWESLPEAKQDQIFGIYKEIQYGFEFESSRYRTIFYPTGYVEKNCANRRNRQRKNKFDDEIQRKS